MRLHLRVLLIILHGCSVRICLQLKATIKYGNIKIKWATHHIQCPSSNFNFSQNVCQLFTFQHLPIVPLYIFSEILILVNWKERVLRTYLTFQAFRTLLFLKKLKEEKYIYVCIWACVFHFPCSLFCCVVSIFHHLCFIVENVLYHFLYCAPFIKHWILLASIPINFLICIIFPGYI